MATKRHRLCIPGFLELATFSPKQGNETNNHEAQQPNEATTNHLQAATKSRLICLAKTKARYSGLPFQFVAKG
jgi:hypothetical protein